MAPGTRFGPQGTPKGPKRAPVGPKRAPPNSPKRGSEGDANMRPLRYPFLEATAPQIFHHLAPKGLHLSRTRTTLRVSWGPTWVQDGPRWPPQTSSSEPRVLMTTFWPISCPKTCRVRSHVSPQRLNFGTMWPRVGPTLEANNVFGCQVRCWDSPDRSTNQSINRSIDQSNQRSQSIN